MNGSPPADYGYDAPFALVMFAALTLLNALGAVRLRADGGARSAIGEAYRALKPAGRLVVADIRATALYEDALRGAGGVPPRTPPSRLAGNPLAATTLLTATKPRG